MGLLSAHIRKVRMTKARPFIRGDVLDIGCGPGDVKQACQAAISRYVGIDYNAANVDRLRRAFPDARFHAIDVDRNDFALNEKFDTVVMIALIEHIFNQRHLFEQAKQCLKPDGRIVVTTPTPFGNDIVHRFGAAVGLFAKSAADDHIVIYNRHRFDILAKELGLRIERYATFEFGCNQLVVLKQTAGA